MGKFGMFGTEEERDAFVAERDRLIAEEAATLAHIGITGPDDLVDKYGALCHLYETGEVPGPDEDCLMSSDGAREFADDVLVIMHGGPWRAETRELMMDTREADDAWADEKTCQRWGYCSKCGAVFPAEDAPFPDLSGTREQVYRVLLPVFASHKCEG